MSKSLIAGIVLTLVGICLLVYQGFRFTTEEKIIDLGPLQVTGEKSHDFPIPPIVGWVVTAAGLAVFVNGLRTSKA